MIEQYGFEQDSEGVWIDYFTKEPLEIHQFDHSIYGAIDYIIVGGTNITVSWTSENYPVDWMEEL